MSSSVNYTHFRMMLKHDFIDLTITFKISNKLFLKHDAFSMKDNLFLKHFKMAFVIDITLI